MRLAVAFFTALCLATVTPPAGAEAESVPEPPPESAASPEIFGGQFATPGSHPWMVALVERPFRNPYLGWFCGGTLISPDTVMTAAHCVEDLRARDLDVVVGTIDLVRHAGERLPVRQIRLHPRYDGWTLRNDVAILQLAQPATLGEPVDIAGPGDEALWVPATPATVTGWGLTETGMASSRLREAQVPIVDDAICNANYGGLFRPNLMLCAGFLPPDPNAGQADSCFGDSGGPLAVDDSGRAMVVGIVSWGFACGDPNYPGVYTEVAAVHPFVSRYQDPDVVPDGVRALRARRVGAEGRGALIRWRAPDFDGGSAILRYRVLVNGRMVVVSGAARQLRVRGLPANRAVSIGVRAQNTIGVGQTQTIILRP